VTLTLAQVNSGLTLNSTYTGTDHPVNTLTVTAKNTAPGEKASSTSQTITVTDPPAGSAPTSVSEIWGGQFDRYPGVFESAFKGNEPSQDGAQVGGPPGLAKVAALFNQFLSAGFPDPAGTSITNVLSQIASNEEQFLTRPHG